MLFLIWLAVWTTLGKAALHHFFVGTIDSSSIYVLEFDDVARTVDLIRSEPATGASPSVTFDRSRKFIFGSRPSDGTISWYSVGPDLALKQQGSAAILHSCNTTTFDAIKLASTGRGPNLIYGAATTGSCSTVFSISVPGFHLLRSVDIAGDIRSFAWSPNGRNLHVLDSASSSLLNFNLADDPTLEELLDTKPIANAVAARHIITHPVGHRAYVVTRDKNELMDIPLLTNDRVNGSASANRSVILFNETPAGHYVTTSVAISSSNATLWTLSHSTGDMSATFMVTVFRLDAETGAVQRRIARASFTNHIGDGIAARSEILPAPFDGDMVAITTYPGGMVAVLGLVGESIKAYGRAMSQDEGCCGDGAWLD